MSQIHILDGQSNQGEILDYITVKNIINDNHKKSKEDTLETYDFITFADKRYSEFLEKRNRIIIPDEDDTLREFVIFEAARYKDSEGYKSQIYTHASYLELKKASVLHPDKGYTGTASQHGGRALNNTGWQMGIVESKGTRTLTIENHTNPFAFLKRIAKEFELELRFRVEHDGNKITGRYVDLLERIGEWRGREVEFGKDLDGIRRVEKQDIVTALLGLGPKKEDGTRLEVLVEDEDALKRWGRVDEYGNLHHLIEPYEIQSERSEMTESETRQYTRTALNKRINTQVTYEGSIVDLENVPGMENKKIRFGDTIRIKDTKFNPPLYLEARIFEQTRSIKSKAKKDIKLGDFVEFSEEEVNNIWDQLRKDIQKRVTAAEMAEYTYSKMLIDEKDEQVYEDGKTFAEATGIKAEQHADFVASEAESNAKGYAELKADEARSAAEKVAEAKAELAELEAKAYADGEVTKEQKRAIQDAQDKLEQAMADAKAKADAAGKAAKDYAVEQDGLLKTTVEGYADRVAQQQADSALSSAKQYAVAKEVYENEMVKIASDIEDRAPLEYVDGKFTIVEDDLKNFNVELDKKVDGSTVYTIEDVDNMINNTVSKTEYTADMDGVVSDIESHGTRIGQNEKAIGLKADESYVDTVENSLNTRIGNVEVTAEGAKMSASEVRADLDNRTTIHDTRDDNEPPSYYWDKYSKETIHEFKRRTTLGITSGETYGILTTVIPWSDPSGGVIKQTFKLNSKTFERTSISRTDDDWTKWIEIENTEDAQKRVDSAVTVLDASIETLAGEVSLKASQSIVDSLENQVENHESELNVLPGQIELKADAAKVDGIDDRLGSAEIIIDGLESEIKLKADLVDIEGMLTADDLAVRKDLKFGGELSGPSGTFGNVTVNEGDITFQDSNTHSKYSIISKRNLIKDHSFEMVKPDWISEDSDSHKYNWFEIEKPPKWSYVFWETYGKPKVAVAVDRNDAPKSFPIFGQQAVVVRSGDFVRQKFSEGVGGGMKLTFSAHFKRQWNQAPGQPRIEIDYIKQNNDGSTSRTRLLSDEFPTVPNDYTYVRHSSTFTVPADFGPEDGLDLKLSGVEGNKNWVQVDGVQLVEGNIPSNYDAEDGVHRLASGEYTPVYSGSPLWTGAVYLLPVHEVIPEKKIMDCANGWVLQWSAYNIGDGPANSHFQYTYLPKYSIYAGGAAGHREMLYRSPGDDWVIKYFYAEEDRVRGHSGNGDGNNRNFCLRAVFEY